MALFLNGRINVTIGEHPGLLMLTIVLAIGSPVFLCDQTDLVRRK